MNWILKFDRWITNTITAGLIITIFTMILLTITAIILRLFNTTFLWIDPLVRHLVFLTAFLGGFIATAKHQHIAIDVVGKILETMGQDHLKKYIDRVIAIAAIAILSWFFLGAVEFVQAVFEFENQVEFFGITRGQLVCMIPAGALLLIYRFFFLLVLSFAPKSEEKCSC